MSEIALTAAMPLYNSANIFWLCLEGLCNQQTTVPWEAVICEDPSTNTCGADYISKYEQRLRDAGCVDIKYIKLKKWVPLGTKWVTIAKYAEGERFMLTASDDFSPPDRIEQTCKYLKNEMLWFDYRRGLFYDIPTGKSASYSSKWPHTGCWMSTKTDMVRKLEIPGPAKYVDGWMQQGLQIPHKYKKTFDVEAKGFHTDGLNNISHARRARYCNCKPKEVSWEMPGRAKFEPPRQNVETITPTDVWNNLQDLRQK